MSWYVASLFILSFTGLWNNPAPHVTEDAGYSVQTLAQLGDAV